jgi:ubiquinone/menaquinone biosynthesis C-methylase UbiE
MELKTLFDGWMAHARTRYAEKQWLLSKWEVCEGVDWPRDKVETMIATIIAGLDLKKTDSLADLGCGGAWIMKILEPYAGQTVGLDFCRDMLVNARLSHPQGRLVQGAIGSLPFKEGTFDKALSYFVFLNFMDDVFVESALVDVWRVVKRGGRALIGQLPDRDRSKDYDAEKKAYLDYCAKAYTVGSSNRDIQRAPQKLFDVPEIRALLERRGIRYEMQPSFNPFYRPGIAPTVTWRFDLVLYKD